MQSSAPDLDNPRLCLLVDDSAVVRRVAGAMFRDLGYIVAEAASGKQALEVCAEVMPDLILLDWNMPEMDGITCLVQLRAMIVPEQPKVILCTTESTLEKIAVAMSAGADEYIMKPFDREVLRDKLVQLGFEEPAEEAA